MRWIIRLIGFVFVLVAVAIVCVLFLPADRIARIATDQLEAATGRTVSIKGDVRFSLWPVLGFRAEGVEVGGPAWSSAPLLVSDQMSVGVDPRQLLNRTILVTHLEATRPTVYLAQTRDGRVSWDVFGATDTSDAPPDAPAVSPQGERAQDQSPAEAAQTEAGQVTFSVERIRITDAKINYDQEGAAPVQLEQVSASLDWLDPTGAATVGLELFPAEEAVVVEAVIDSFMAFLSGQVQGVQSQIETTGGRFSFDGRASTAGAASGLISLQTDTTAVFLQSLGIDVAELPANLGKRVNVTAQSTLTPDLKLALRDMVIGLENNRLIGALDMALETVPIVNAQFDAGTLDLRSLFAEDAANSSPSGNTVLNQPQSASPQPQTAGAGSGWPTDPIDASVLSTFEGAIALSASGVDLDAFTLGPTRTILRNENSRMVFELREVQAYGGQVTGDFVVNNRGGLSVGGRINAADVEMQPLFADAVDLDRLTGAASLAVAFLGSGSSVNDIMRSLSGDGRISVGRGTIEGINLDRLMRGDTAASGTTIFDNLSGTWTIAQGVLNNDDLLFQLKNYEARGAGVVGLGAQTLDYVFTPVALRANSGQGLALPVRFQGPWSDISIRPDFDAALDMRIDEEVDAAKEKVDAEIDAITDKADAEIDAFERDAKEKLQSELGISPAEGQSTEDAVKEELTNRLLRKLFD
ncbi:MAG: AsmA family protein [Roseobacter sp.]